jgi:hypothetical protein
MLDLIGARGNVECSLVSTNNNIITVVGMQKRHTLAHFERRPPQDADRPSDFIEPRFPIVQEMEELGEQATTVPFDYASIFDVMPSLQGHYQC